MPAGTPPPAGDAAADAKWVAERATDIVNAGQTLGGRSAALSRARAELLASRTTPLNTAVVVPPPREPASMPEAQMLQAASASTAETERASALSAATTATTPAAPSTLTAPSADTVARALFDDAVAKAAATPAPITQRATSVLTVVPLGDDAAPAESPDDAQPEDPVVDTSSTSVAQAAARTQETTEPGSGLTFVASTAREFFTAVVDSAKTAISDNVIPYMKREAARVQRGHKSTGPTYDEITGKGRAALSILSLDDDTPVGQPFRDLYIISVQEQRAEKADVVETFGAPHFFASGKFVARYAFTAIVRSTPSTEDAQAALASRAAQWSTWGVFYDKYLRMTVQAERGQYTKISIAGDNYYGWITGDQKSRTAETELTAIVNFTMVGVKRSHDRDHDVTEPYLDQYKRPARAAEYDETRAKADLAAALGKSTLRLVHNGNETSNPVQLTVPGVLTASSLNPPELAALNSQLALVAKDAATLLSATTSPPDCGVELRITTGDAPVPINGAGITPGVPRALSVSVTDHRKLLTAAGVPEGAIEAVTIPVTFQISPQFGTAAAPLTLSLTVSPQASVKLGAIKYTVGGSSVTETDAKVIPTLEVDRAAAISTDTINVVVTAPITQASGAPVSLAGDETVIFTPRTVATPAQLSTKMDFGVDKDAALLTGTAVSPATSSVTNGIATFTVPVKLQGSAVYTSNPFFLADALRLQLGGTISFSKKSYADVKLRGANIMIKLGDPQAAGMFEAITRVEVVSRRVSTFGRTTSTIRVHLQLSQAALNAALLATEIDPLLRNQQLTVSTKSLFTSGTTGLTLSQGGSAGAADTPGFFYGNLENGVYVLTIRPPDDLGQITEATLQLTPPFTSPKSWSAAK